jgi:hypothetical protein
MKVVATFFGGILLMVSSGMPGYTQSEEIHQHRIWDQLLQEYVSSTGEVDYLALKQEPSRLNQYLAQLTRNPVSDSWSRSQKLAYWINAYNAFTVKLIIDNYPVASIRDIQRPWARKFIELGHQKYSLNQIENDIVRPVFQEPRIHFALVCAAKSCPKLLNNAYRSDLLDQQLDDQTHYFLNESGKNQLAENHIQISKLFSWYGQDFKKQGSIIDFLNQHSNIEIDSRAKVEYLPYDWSLNN